MAIVSAPPSVSRRSDRTPRLALHIRWTRSGWAASAAAAAVGLSLLVAPPAAGEPIGPGDGQVEAEDPSGEWPVLPDTPSVAGDNVAIGGEDAVDGPWTPPVDVVFPSGGSATITVVDPAGISGDARLGDAGEESALVDVGGLPFGIAESAAVGVLADGARSGADASEAESPPIGPAEVRIEVHPQSVSAAADVTGVIISIASVGGTAAGPLDLTLGYDGFTDAVGGDWASRLRLYEIADCILITPEDPACHVRTDVGALNDARDGRVTATLTPAHDSGRVGAASDGERGTGVADGSFAGTDSEGTVLLLGADADGETGDWGATPLSPSATWQVSAQTGGFSWSYPIGVPPGLGGPQPTLAVSYASASVDGRMASTNNQTSWVGDGWDLASSFIERKYASCADDGEGGNNENHKSGDLCWRTNNATLVLNGQASELVFDAGSEWRLRTDDGSVVKRKLGGSNGDNDGEYWELTAPDGIVYVFGKTNVATGADASTPTWTVPVFGNHTGEDCYDGPAGSDFDDSWCQQAWRWNLERVIDPRGNSMSLFYAAEKNNYALDNGALDYTGQDVVEPYVRGGYLNRIDYGDRSGSEASTEAPAQVVFAAADRCLAADCRVVGPSNFPDVPTDLICDSATSCPEVTAPAFFTRKRLTTVTTNVLADASSGDRREVDEWTLEHQFPSPGDGSNPVLWLRSIQHEGLASRPADPAVPVTLPKVTFDKEQRANRVDAVGDYASPMIRYRVSGIDTESGGHISITYSGEDCTPASNPGSNPHTNTRRCFPVMWTPDGLDEPIREYFHKYVVNAVSSDPGGVHDITADPEVVTGYNYIGGAAWHWNDDPLLTDEYRTWSEFRGYQTVEITSGAATEPRSQTRSLFLRGMHGDHLPGGGTRSVSVTDSQGNPTTDHETFAGFERESITLDGPGGTELSGTINTPWRSSAPTAIDPDGRRAYLLNTSKVDSRTTTPDGPNTTRETSVETTFDSAGYSITVNDRGDLALTADDRCTRTEYVRNTAKNILGTVKRSYTVAKSCQTTPTFPADAINDTRNSYDGGAPGTAPTQGLLTKVEHAKSYNGGTPQYVTVAETDHDALGRLTSHIDALGRVTTTAYTPAGSGPLTRTTVTSPDPDGAGSLTTHVTRADLDPAWGSPFKITDANGKITAGRYDALGRQTAVWFPGRVKGTDTPDKTYDYLIRRNGPTAVTTNSLIHDGSYLTAVELYDGLLRPRQTQTSSLDREQPGRVITDTLYDSRGQVRLERHPYFTSGGAPVTTLFAPSGSVPGRTLYTYDGAARITETVFEVQLAEAWRTSTRYGGDRTHVTPPAGASPTTTITDARGRTTELRQYHGVTTSGQFDQTSYTHTPAGQLRTVLDDAGNTWTYTYDLRGRQIQADDPDAGASTSVFDDAGQVITTTDARGVTLTHTYDQLGRKIRTKQGSVTLATWVYDSLEEGQLTSATRWAGSSAYVTSVTGYDDAYRPQGQTVTLPTAEGALAGPYTTTMTYTLDGQLASVGHPAVGGVPAETVYTEYDELSMPANMWGSGLGSGGGYVGGSLHNPYGEVELVDLTPDATDAMTFLYEEGTHRLLRADLLREQGPGIETGLLVDRDYTYDDAGNITSIIDTPASASNDKQCFDHDHLRRLTTAWTPSGGCAAAPNSGSLAGPAPYFQSFTYDVTGNRLTENNHVATGDTVTSYAYPAAGSDRPHATTEIAVDAPGTLNDRTTAYNYDLAGRTTRQDPDDAAADTYTYDAEGHLSSTGTRTGTGGALETTSYVYTADGDRLIRREADVTTAYLPGGTEVKLSGATETAQRHYSYAGQTIATRTGTGIANVKTLVPDHQGTASITINAGDHSVNRRYQTPFGAPRGSTPAWPGDHGFLDAPTDQATTGWVHLGAREYTPIHGRFLTVDPLVDLTNPQTLNGYAYALNTPVTMSDPSGLAVDPGGTGYNGPCPPTLCPGAPGGGSPPIGIPPGPPPERETTTGVFAGLSGEMVSNLAVELATDGQLYDYPGVTAVPLSAWERKAYFVDERIALITGANNNADPMNAIRAIDDLFIGVDDLMSCSDVGGCIFAAVTIVPMFKLLKFSDKGLDALRATKTPAVGDDLLRPGQWAKESVPSSGPGRITQAERNQLNPIGDQYGCHSCGATGPGVKSGNWVGDHQPVSRTVPPGTPQVLYPQCQACSNAQGLWVINRIRQGLL